MGEDTDKDSSDFLKIALDLNTGTSTATAAALLGADLVVVALAWDNPPSEGGIVSITFLMMFSFVAFINVLHQIMRYEFLISRFKVGEVEQKLKLEDSQEFYRLSKLVRILHISGLLFTMIAFWLISYKYLISIVGYNFLILCLPFILFIMYWLPKMKGVEREVSFSDRENLFQLLIQIIFLVLICFDYIGILTIP